MEAAIHTRDGRERTRSLVSSALGAQSDGRRLLITVGQDVTEQRSTRTMFTR